MDFDDATIIIVQDGNKPPCDIECQYSHHTLILAFLKLAESPAIRAEMGSV
jgi:hypothetical protein